MITVTEEAKQHLIKLLDEQANCSVIELGLEEQGCNGFKYTWNPVVVLTDKSYFVELDQEHRIVIRERFLPLLMDSKIVIESIGLNKKLTIINPNVAGSCGCGESVNFADV